MSYKSQQRDVHEIQGVAYGKNGIAVISQMPHGHDPYLYQ